MNFYVVLTVILAILLMFNREYSLKTGLFISVLLCFLSAFRGEKVGHDTASYIDIAYIQQRADSSLGSLSDFTDIDTSVEFIANALSSIVCHLGLNGRWMIVFYAIIMIVFMYMSCKRLNVSPTYTMAFFVVLGFYFYSLSACRQICAVSVIMYAMTYLNEEDRSSRYFFLWIVVAAMIHSMSFICLPLYFVRKLPQYISYRTLGWSFFVISLFLTLVKIDFLNQLSILASSDHLSSYLEEYGQSSTSLSSIAGCWIETGCLFYFFMLKKYMDEDEQMTVFDYLFLISMLISAALLQYDGLVARVKYNVIIMQCYYLASLFEREGVWHYKLNLIVLAFMMLRVAKNYFFEVALESDYYLCFF